MKTRSLVVGTSLALALVAGVHAQMIGGLSVSPATAKVGEPVTVSATVDIVGGNYCGFIVFFGDGQSAESYSDVGRPMPFVSTHAYAKAGTYQLSMGGRHVQNHPNCGGADKLATGTITEAALVAPVAAAGPSCPEKFSLVAKSVNAKTGAYTCSSKPVAALPSSKPVCAPKLKYFQDAKKGLLGCRK